MTMRPFTDNRGGLNHLVDAQIGRAFPVVHKVYEHLDAIEYIAQVYEAGRARDIVIRTNHTKEWIEWQYKGDAKWTILFKFGDLLGADIADVVATEQAIAAELVQLRQQLATDAKNVIAARDAANAAHSGAEAARTAAETARDVAQASETAAAQYAQNLEDAKTVVQVSANQVAADRLLAEQAAHNAEIHAGTAGSHVTTVIEARQAAEEFAAEANAAKSATALLQTAAEQSAQAADQSQIAAMNSASAAAASATAAGVSAQTAAAHQTATEAAATTGAKHLADIQAQVVSAETIKQETVDAYQAGLAAKVSAEAAAAGAVEARQTTSTMYGAVEQLHDETRVMLLSVESLHGETQVFRNEAEQMRIDAQVVAADRQRAEDAYAGAQSAATQAGVAADRAATSEQASVGAAATAATAAAELSGLLTDIDSRLDGAETLRTQVQLLHDQTLEYKNTVQGSTVNAQAVANDRAAVTAMMGTIAADAASAVASAASAADSKDQALAAAATAVQTETAAKAALTVAQDAAQAVANNTSDAQSAATRAEEAATKAGSFKQVAESAASTATVAATEVAEHLSVISGHVTDVSDLHNHVQQLHDQTLAYKNTAQGTVVNAQAVADDRAAVADMKAAVSADALATNTSRSQTEAAALAAATSRDQAVSAATTAESAKSSATASEVLARAWASKMDGPVLNDGEDKFSAQYWAAQAEQMAADATDANTGAHAAMANHTSDSDPHTQYLQKTDLPIATDIEMQAGVEDTPRRMSPRQVKSLVAGAPPVVVEEVTASKQMLPDVHYVVVTSGVTLSLPASVAAGSRFTCMDASGAGFLVNWGAHTVKFGTPDSPMQVPARAGFSVIYSGGTFA